MMHGGLQVVTGMAGSGKTEVLAEVARRSKTVLLVAPPARPPASLKKGRGFRHVRFTRSCTPKRQLVSGGSAKLARTTTNYDDEEEEEQFETVIVDEAGMVDLEWMHKLFLHLPDGVQRVALFGDPDQLSPVSAGEPFLNLVNVLKKEGSNHHLTENHRQNEYHEAVRQLRSIVLDRTPPSEVPGVILNQSLATGGAATDPMNVQTIVDFWQSEEGLLEKAQLVALRNRTCAVLNNAIQLLGMTSRSKKCIDARSVLP
jgi:hypothetical protein